MLFWWSLPPVYSIIFLRAIVISGPLWPFLKTGNLFITDENDSLSFPWSRNSWSLMAERSSPNI